LYGEGISKAGCILDIAVDQNIVNKSGAWYSYGDSRIGQGRDNARDFLKQNPAVMAEVEAKVLERLNLARDTPKPAEVPVAEKPSSRKS